MRPRSPTTASSARANGTARNVLGIRLTFDKRYITLAPVATLIGVAFRMYDPDGLLGDKRDIGISLALVPRDTPGLEIGRRHFPLNTPFQNGPIHGKEVFVPLSQLIGGEDYAGKGWRMLVRDAVDRPLDHPALHRQRRRQDGRGRHRRVCAHPQAVRPVDRPLRRRRRSAGAHRRQGLCRQRVVAGHRRRRCARRESRGAVDDREIPLHRTGPRSRSRTSMDIHGGKGIILGPRNYAGPRLAGHADQRSRSKARTS